MDNIQALTSPFFYNLILYFGLNCLSLWLLIRYIYLPNYANREMASSYLMLSSMVFLAIYSLKDVNVSMGFAFGLFAIFSILRYRTETVSMPHMSYLFVSIGLAMLNAASTQPFPILLSINVLVFVSVLVAQYHLMRSQERKKKICYDRIDLILPEKHHELIADINKRTGLITHKVEIDSIDFLRDTSMLTIYYTENEANPKELT